MRIFLTGATGLIGQETASELARAGHEVIAISRSGRMVGGAAEAMPVDLTDRKACRDALAATRPEALVHLAWYGGPGRMGARENVQWAATTLGLVFDFAEAGGRQVVAAGSCAEYDWSRKGVHKESDSLKPQGVYGLAKAHAGQLLAGSADALGLTMAWARIFFVYGSGEPKGRLFGDLIRGLRARRTVPCTDGEQVRDFLHAADVGRALTACLDAGVAGPINIGSGQGIRVRDLITETAQLMKAPELISLGEIKRPEDDPAAVVADVSRLSTETEFVPQFDVKSGIRDIVARDYDV